MSNNCWFFFLWKGGLWKSKLLEKQMLLAAFFCVFGEWALNWENRSSPGKTLILAPPFPHFLLFSECAENSACHQQSLECFEEHKLSRWVKDAWCCLNFSWTSCYLGNQGCARACKWLFKDRVWALKVVLRAALLASEQHGQRKNHWAEAVVLFCSYREKLKSRLMKCLQNTCSIRQLVFGSHCKQSSVLKPAESNSLLIGRIASSF